MAQSIKDFLQHTFSIAGIDQQQYNEIIEAVEGLETEVSDELSEAFNTNIITRERATKDKDIQKHFRDALDREIRKQILDEVDRVIDPEANKLLSDEQREVFDNMKTPQKIGMVVKELQKKAKGDSTGADDETIERFNKKINSLQDELAQSRDLLEAEKTAAQKAIEQYKTDYKLKSKIHGFNLTKNIPGGKDFLADATINSLKSRFVVKLDERGEPKLFDKENPESEAYDPKLNKKVEVDAWLRNELDDFIVKNDGGGGGQGPGGQTHRRTVEIKDPAKATLREIRQATANS